MLWSEPGSHARHIHDMYSLLALTAVTALQSLVLVFHAVQCIMHVRLRPVRPSGDEAAPQCTMYGTRGEACFCRDLQRCILDSDIASGVSAIRRAILGLRLLCIYLYLR